MRVRGELVTRPQEMSHSCEKKHYQNKNVRSQKFYRKVTYYRFLEQLETNASKDTEAVFSSTLTTTESKQDESIRI